MKIFLRYKNPAKIRIFVTRPILQCPQLKIDQFIQYIKKFSTNVEMLITRVIQKVTPANP